MKARASKYRLSMILNLLSQEKLRILVTSAGVGNNEILFGIVFRNDEIVKDTPVLISENCEAGIGGAIAAEALKVDCGQRLEKFCRILALNARLQHVADIEQRGESTSVLMGRRYRIFVLDRQQPAGKVHYFALSLSFAQNIQ